MFNFWGNCQIISKVVVPFYTPISRCRRVPPILNMMSLFNFRHSNNCIVISCWGFNLNFSNDQKCWASVHVLIFRIYIYSLVKCLFSFCPLFYLGIFFLILQFWEFLYILITSALADLLFVFIFLQFVACFITLLTVSFKEYNFVILMRFDSFSFFFLYR